MGYLSNNIIIHGRVSEVAMVILIGNTLFLTPKTSSLHNCHSPSKKSNHEKGQEKPNSIILLSSSWCDFFFFFWFFTWKVKVPITRNHKKFDMKCEKEKKKKSSPHPTHLFCPISMPPLYLVQNALTGPCKMESKLIESIILKLAKENMPYNEKF